jgi:hypothetical protein
MIPKNPAAMMAILALAACTGATLAAHEKITLWSEKAPLGDGQFDATLPTITVHKPVPEKATGTAMVICPGGGYGGLVTGAEGHGIAKWLGEHGIAGIVLELPTGGHGSNGYKGPGWDAWQAKSLEWLTAQKLLAPVKTPKP